MRFGRGFGWVLMVGGLAGVAGAQERLPTQLAGTWRITRVLPQRAGGACWTEKDAQVLVGSTLEYGAHAMRWKGGTVPLLGVTTRSVTAADVQQEAIDPSQSDASITLTSLGIAGSRTLEVNLQHEDMDITGSTTEVPGDSVLVAGPGRIVMSVCGVYLEARRAGARAEIHAGAVRPGGARRGL